MRTPLFNQEFSESWISWARSKGHNVSLHPRIDDRGRCILGYFIQAVAEHPVEFHRVFRSLLQGHIANPLVAADFDWLTHLVRNGVQDDWEIHLHWSDEGYVVVPERLAKPQDSRFGESHAKRVLDLLTGGQRAAIEVIDEDQIIQEAYSRST